MRFKMMLTVAASVLALATACRGDDIERSLPPSPTPQAPPVTSGGSVAPDLFMTFQGRLYRARDVRSDLINLDNLAPTGTTDEIGIDHTARVEVYRLRDSTSDALYTFEPGRQLSEKEGDSTPGVWLEWAPVDGQADGGGSSEPGSGGGADSVEPGAPPAEPDVTPGDQAAPPPGPSPATSPDDVVSATPAPGPGSTPETTPDPSALAEEARAHLAQRLGIGVDTIEVMSVVQEWLPHQSCLNLEPGAACIEIAVDGYRVTLSAQGLAYAYYGYPNDGVYPVP